MKNYKALLMIFVLIFSFNVQGQSYQITELKDTLAYHNCDSILTADFTFGTFGNGNGEYRFNVLANNYTAGPITLYVSWGDGTSSNYQGQTSNYGSQIIFTNNVSHTYQGYGHFSPIFAVFNPNNNTFASDTIDYFVGACDNFFAASVVVDCDSNQVADTTYSDNVPFELSNGQNFYTFTTSNLQGYLSQMIPGTYNATINSSWLTSNGYAVTTMFPNFITVGPNGNNQFTLEATLHCDSTGASNNGCINGLVFCDDNDNGVYDTSDSGIPNAPITVTYQNQNYFGVTNSNGYYYIGYPNANQDSLTVTVNAQWLAQNGYYAPNNSQHLASVLCQPGGNPPVNFGINCDSAQTQNECVGGSVFCDMNQNGLRDPGENSIPYAPVHLTGQNGSLMVYTNPNGIFWYSGTHFGGNSVTVNVDQNWLTQHGYGTTDYDTVSLNCDSLNPVHLGLDCNNGGSGCANLWSTMNTWIGYYQNYTNQVKINWGCNGPNSPQSYQLTLTYPVGVFPVTSTISNPNYVISGNTITWTISSSSSYFSDYDVISFYVPTGFPSGTQHYYLSDIVATGNVPDCDSTNNHGGIMMILGNSYDPNDKAVNKAPYISPDVQDELIYTIRFQNTGDAPAQDIYVLDTISSLLDFSTFSMTESSHDMQLIELGNGVLKFNFPGIWLPDSTTNEPESHGQFTYRIKEKVFNGVGTVIKNTAHIYFDFNPAIVTNTTINENNYLSVGELDQFNFSVYPNPANEQLVISSDVVWNTAILKDMNGREIKQLTYTNAINVENLESGLYFLVFSMNDQNKTVRFIKN